MKYDWLDEYCLSKKGAVREFKAEWEATRYLIGGKMFAMDGGVKDGKPITHHHVKMRAGLWAVFAAES